MGMVICGRRVPPGIESGTGVSPVNHAQDAQATIKSLLRLDPDGEAADSDLLIRLDQGPFLTR